MSKVGIVGIMVDNRADRAEKVQHVITQYGDSIIARMGVPSRDRFTGIITITMEAGEDRIVDFVEKLAEVEGVKTSYSLL